MRNSVEDFADTIRETLNNISAGRRLDYVDSAVHGVLRSVISGPGTDDEVRAWFRNALDAGDLVRAELAGMDDRPKETRGGEPC